MRNWTRRLALLRLLWFWFAIRLDRSRDGGGRERFQILADLCDWGSAFFGSHVKLKTEVGKFDSEEFLNAEGQFVYFV